MLNWFWIVGLLGAWMPMASAATSPNKQHGEQVFRVCGACHHERPDATGPDLRGVVGRKAGSVDGFRYSNAMKRSSLVWTVENLRAYLRDPQAVIKGNRMPFPGLPADSDVDDVVAFLQDFK